MGKISKAVFDAGPFIHLHEIERLSLTRLFLSIITTPEIFDECKRIQQDILLLKNVERKNLSEEHKNFAKLLLQKYDLDLGEATGIAMCKQEAITLFFTDDLEARETAARLGLSPHGTLAIILRSFREKLLNREETKKAVEKIYEDSSLFFTKDLYNWTLKEIERFS